MSFVIAAPEALLAAASDFAGIGSMIDAANAVAAAPTVGVLAAGADEVSTRVAALFGGYAREYQAHSAAVWVAPAAPRNPLGLAPPSAGPVVSAGA
ncbi:PE family protein, partial [Mycobacterium shinjukuense]